MSSLLFLAPLLATLLAAPPGLFAPNVKQPAPHVVKAAPWARAFARDAEAERKRHVGDPIHPAAIGAFILDVDRKQRAGFHDETPMALASGVKLFVMVEAFRQRETGALRFDEPLPYTAAFIRDGAHQMNKQPLGSMFSVEALLKLMIRDSDNAATDMLLARLGTEEVHRTALALGAAGPIVSMLDHRRSVYRALDERADHLDTVQVRDIRWRNGYAPRLDLLKQHIGPPFGTYDDSDLDRAFAQDYARGTNHAPMRTVGALLWALADKRLVSRAASEEMIALLFDVATSDRRVEGALPDDVSVAHKTGTSHKRVCDLGIVYLPDGSPLVVAVAVAGGERTAAEDVIARLSRRAYDLAWAARQKPGR